MIEKLRDLHRHMAWADGRALDSLVRSAGAPPQALEIYAHVLGAEAVWLSRLRQETASVAVWPEPDLDACARLAAENARAFLELLDRLEEPDLEREVPYTNSAGRPYRSKIADILLHVFLHGAYHRGQVALLLRSHGQAPEPTDYIAFVRGAPAATRTS